MLPQGAQTYATYCFFLQHVVSNNVAICCVELLRAFGQVLHNISQHTQEYCDMLRAFWPGPSVDDIALFMSTDPCEDPSLCTHPYHQCQVLEGKAVCVCPMVITANLDPVCGSDGQTYPNPGALESMSCLANRMVEEEYRGQCKGVYYLRLAECQIFESL